MNQNISRELRSGLRQNRILRREFGERKAEGQKADLSQNDKRCLQDRVCYPFSF